jgi:putative peptidoglycan lipid II flippase
MMSRHLRAGEIDHAMHNQNRAIELAMLLTVPAAAALLGLCAQIISVLFERGAFGAEASRATSAALAAYALGLPA